MSSIAVCYGDVRFEKLRALRVRRSLVWFDYRSFWRMFACRTACEGSQLKNDRIAGVSVSVQAEEPSLIVSMIRLT